MVIKRGVKVRGRKGEGDTVKRMWKSISREGELVNSRKIEGKGYIRRRVMEVKKDMLKEERTQYHNR